VSVDTSALRGHAARVSAAQLRRARGRLGTLAPQERRAVEELATAVADGVAACLLEGAERDPAIAAALDDLLARPSPDRG
jgi:hypothetical protein